MGLVITSGICWTIVYIELIRLAFKEKSCGMPLWALGLNIAWEAIYAYMDIKLGGKGFIKGQWIISLVWVALDIVILYTYFKFEKMKFHADKKYFIPWTIMVIICCFAVQLCFLNTFGFHLGSRLSAFIQNLAMSIMFVYMFMSKAKGQSIIVAVFKFIGTLCPTIYIGFIEKYNFVILFGLLCALYDIIYIIALHQQTSYKIQRNENISI